MAPVFFFFFKDSVLWNILFHWGKNIEIFLMPNSSVEINTTYHKY